METTSRPVNSPPEHAAPPARVWVVEDEPDYLYTMALLLESTPGMCCAGRFSSGEAALSELESKGVDAYPEVVLMDVNMPGLGGIASTERLKALLPEVPIVMLTIRDDAETIFEAFRAGASGYLLKDSPIDTITAAIREALGGGMLMPAPVARKVQAFFSERGGPAPADYGLSPREREVLEKMVEGLSQKEIAAQLFICVSTVNVHVQHIYEKLHVHSSSAAVAKAVRERLVSAARQR